MTLDQYWDEVYNQILIEVKDPGFPRFQFIGNIIEWDYHNGISVKDCARRIIEIVVQSQKSTA